MVCSINMHTFFLGSHACPVSGHFTLQRKIGHSFVKCAQVLDDHGTLIADHMPVETTSLGTLSRSSTERKFEPEERELGNGKFGRFGGKFVPETLMTCLSNLEAEFKLVLRDSEFQVMCFPLTFPRLH